MMKTKGLRKSKNVEVQTEKQRIAAGYGKKLQDKVLGNTSLLHDPTPVQEWGDARDTVVKQLTNPGLTQYLRPSTKSPAQRRKIKDPKPADFEFFKHHTTEK
jgi:hypothetical protein